MSISIVVVEVDLFRQDGAPTTLRLCNRGPMTRSVAGHPVQYEPTLYTPILIGQTISAAQYGNAARGTTNSGEIQFGITNSLRPLLNAHWAGSPCRIYIGSLIDELDNKDVDDLTLAWTGRVSDFRHDTYVCRIETADNLAFLDNPLISETFGDESPDYLRGKYKPRLWGTAYSIEPVLIDNPTQLFMVSTSPAVIDNVWVGGVIWDKVASSPRPGQWKDIGDGTFVFGGDPGQYEIRVDARSSDYADITAAKLFQDLVELGGGTVNAAALAEMNNVVTGRVGFHASDAINLLSALDEIAAGHGFAWWINSAGEATAHAIAVPDNVAAATLTDAEILSFQQTAYYPPAWRLRVEIRRNWTPATQFLGSVTIAEQKNMSASGFLPVAGTYFDDSIKTYDKLAVDVPTLRSLLVTTSYAQIERDRLWSAWSVPRHEYSMKAFADNIEPYDTISINFNGIVGNFRVLGVAQSFGGGPAEFVLWG